MSYLDTPEGRAVLNALCGEGDLIEALAKAPFTEREHWPTAAVDLVKLLSADKQTAWAVVALLTAHLRSEILDVLNDRPAKRERIRRIALGLSAEECGQIKHDIFGIKGGSTGE